MRFMTGMLFGAAFTLLAATAMDAPTQSLVTRTTDQAQSALADACGDHVRGPV